MEFSGIAGLVCFGLVGEGNGCMYGSGMLTRDQRTYCVISCMLGYCLCSRSASCVNCCTGSPVRTSIRIVQHDVLQIDQLHEIPYLVGGDQSVRGVMLYKAGVEVGQPTICWRNVIVWQANFRSVWCCLFLLVCRYIVPRKDRLYHNLRSNGYNLQSQIRQHGVSIVAASSSQG